MDVEWWARGDHLCKRSEQQRRAAEELLKYSRDLIGQSREKRARIRRRIADVVDAEKRRTAEFDSSPVRSS